jgi:type I restriction enzyme, S subunit
MPDMRKLKPYNNYQSVKYDYVAQVPEGWKLLPNIAVFEERIERGFIDEELLSVTIGRGVIRQTDVDIKKDSSNEDKSKYKLIKIGDIAYNRMRMWQGALGYSDYRGITSPAYVILKPKMDINQRFFHYMFRTDFYTNYSKRFSYGIVDDQLSLRYVDFKRMYSIVPPIEAQNDIVTYLDRKTKKTREFIQKKERLIELLEEEKRVIIIGECNKHSQKHLKKIKFVARICNGQDQKSIEDVNGKFHIYGSGGVIGHTNSYLHDKKSVLLGRKGTIDKPIYVEEPFWSIDTAFYTDINERKILPEYFYYVCTFLPFEEYTYGSAIPSMTQAILNNIEIPLPNKDIQKQVIKLIKLKHKTLDIAISRTKSEIDKAKEYQESLITQIVTGQLKVPTLTLEKALN